MVSKEWGVILFSRDVSERSHERLELKAGILCLREFKFQIRRRFRA